MDSTLLEHVFPWLSPTLSGPIADAAACRDHLAKLYAAFREVNAELRDGRQFLMSDEVSIADAFWPMKILRLLECGYPVQSHHPELYEWYQRVCARPSLQNEVMSRNRLTNRAFRAKAHVENLFGKGLRQAVDAVAVRGKDRSNVGLLRHSHS